MKHTVNPNRMELLRLRKRLVFARRGHKLLKDKQDELLRHFLRLINEIKPLREKVENRIDGVYKYFSISQMGIPRVDIDGILNSSGRPRFACRERNLMNMRIPEFEFEFNKPAVIGHMPFELNYSMQAFYNLLPELIALAEKEKSIEILAYELQRTRRRVNALEYILIPALKNTIRFIADRLNELERSNITRLMKIKTLVAR
ncbi:MAG: V-type ATP synthase subunit D [Elusimicrobia bacterium]|nr:V-type ATP synthase subunit D [Elusimicrobiota bacterium]